MKYRLVASLTFLSGLYANNLHAQTEDYVDSNLYSQTVFGGTGLIQTPTSRMAPEGSFSLNYSDNDQYRFWSVSLQLFPWMESTVRYTDVRNLLYSQSEAFSGDQTWKDKGIDVKFRLLEEDYWLPEFSVGFKDIGGTGVFSSEYLTLSKRWGDFDLHLGLGFGYLGRNDNATNPFCQLADRFCQREAGYSGRGGKVEFDKFFSGQAAWFGGLEYQSPWRPLRFSLEYDPNHYQNDKSPDLTQDSRWNIAANYRWKGFDFALRFERGNTVTFGFSYQTNFNTLTTPKVKPLPKEVHSSNKITSFDEVDENTLLLELNNNAGFPARSTQFYSDTYAIFGTQLDYRDPDESIERIGRVLASQLPDTVKKYQVVELAGAMPLITTEIDAGKFKQAAGGETFDFTLSDTYERKAVDNALSQRYSPAYRSGLGGSVETFFIQTFGNPEAFYLYQAGVLIQGVYSLNSKFNVIGTAKATLLENFDKFNYKQDPLPTPLPRVRTNMREYVTRSTVTLENLFGHSFFRMDENSFGQVYAGYLESMYAGVGAEWLYRPVDANWSFGVDLNYVTQRSYESEFELFDYKAFTGHVNVTYEPTLEALSNTRISIKAGQFLAKDKGVQIEFAKRFDSGIVVGAYAAFTNVSAEEYGEGSFTKGFYITVPVDLFVFRPATGKAKFPWIPIARDGGQILQRPVQLLDLTEKRSRFMN